MSTKIIIIFLSQQQKRERVRVPVYVPSDNVKNKENLIGIENRFSYDAYQIQLQFYERMSGALDKNVEKNL